MLKIMTIVGTRPEIIRLACVMQELDRTAKHVLVHTGQNYDYELNKIFFDDLNLRMPDYFLDAAGKSAVSTIAQIIEKTDGVLSQEKPDAILILGDTNSCLAAIAAKKRKIPIFHMEAGNRCFDQRVPEEINRKIVDHISDINMPYSKIAREYLLREGLSPDRIIRTGSPMYEVLKHYSEKINSSKVLGTLGLQEKQYYVVSCHREENVDSDINITNLINVLNALAEKERQPVIVSTHPRTRKRIDELGIELNAGVRLLKPLSFSDYVKLQLESKIVLSDSGTISEESSILGFNAVNIREAHERPEAMEEGSVVMSGLEPDSVIDAIELTLNQTMHGNKKTFTPDDYNVSNVSTKVARIIYSYTHYVNNTVWRKNVKKQG